MLFYYIFSFICIAILFGMAIAYLVVFLKRDRAGKIDLIQSFKTGLCVFVYLFAIPLYMIGHIYAKRNILDSFFSAIKQGVSLVVFGYDTTSISLLMQNNWAYSLAIYVCFFVTTVNTLLFIASFIHSKAWEYWQEKNFNKSKEDRLLIIGYNDENLKIYASEIKRRKIILDQLSNEQKNKLYIENTCFISKGNNGANGPNGLSDLAESACKILENSLATGKSCILIVNTKDDDKNIALCHSMISRIELALEKKSKEYVSDAFSRVKVYVFGNPEYETIYHSLVENSHGCVRYVNKYKQIAIDFVEKYPLTQFMTEAQLDYDNALLRNEINVNVALIGFGRTNAQIFLTSTANNQFMTVDNGKLLPKQVKYYIFDKQHLENNKNLNHSYYRFRNETSDDNKEDYLPLPTQPAIEHYSKMDINDPSFYQELKNSLCVKNAFNYIVIAFGNDLENLDMAHKIIEKKLEWGIDDTYIFVKVRSGDGNYTIFNRSDCFMIGDEDRVVFNIDCIDNDVITKMAKMRNRIYALEYEIMSTPNMTLRTSVDTVYANAERDWYIKKTQFERESNLYACLALRSKLHMLGLDYCKTSELPDLTALTENTYLSKYAKDDAINYHDSITADGKKIVKYDIDFKESIRSTLAKQEHLRWNSFMIGKGFVPAKISDILADTKSNGKSYSLRRHGNLTTFEGLIQFRKLVAERDKKDESKKDVIKYDYQLLDDAFWLLTSNGYKIVSREK